MDQDRRQRGLGAAQQRTDTGSQLGKGKRLGRAIIGALVQPGHPVFHRSRSGQHQHPRSAPGGGDLGAYIIAMQARQIPVKHHYVVVREQRPVQPAATIEGNVDGQLPPAQEDGDHLGKLRIVFDHQHPHDHSYPRRRAPALPAPRPPGRGPRQQVAHHPCSTVTPG